ncbi:glutamyl-tRNA synthetase [Leucogyrophana mollusca]|uniref:Glutamyl-tRNA synthetase n=1 Tax=Leucogyrophana mollusca TaxID=85980 RepID=A0ACB8BDN8_9AGAM|nr:glutamyl-tRNA synthetase [Leucogyrophana mollusca]
MVLLRFAPSPTGALHLGGLRTALYNHLYAKKLGGKWILRIEDTDATRYVPGAVDGIRGALAWAGLAYDHGPGSDGPHGPYFQSERLDLYHSYTRKLLDSGHAYRCFCSPDKLTTTREKLARTGSNATYDKACLHLTEEEVARRVRAGEKSIVRLNDDNLPARTTPSDIVFGSLKDAHASLPTDPVLLKSDLFPTYHLASVVDDHEMGITHVLRGEEWLPSLPLHLDLYSCLSLIPPQFAHLPILLNPDGSKMSKRKGDVQVLDFMRRGWEPDAVLNWLALSGWGVHHDRAQQPSPSSDTSHSTPNQAPDSTRLMTLSELIDQFELTSLTHRRNVLDPAKLEFLNKHHLMRSWQTEEGITAHAERLHDLIKAAFPTSRHTTVEYIAQVIRALQGRIINLLDVPRLAPFFFVDPDYTTEEAQSMIKSISPSDYRTTLDAVAARLESHSGGLQSHDIGTMLHDEASKLDVKQKHFMTALRHALTGMKTGPSIPEITEVLGLERAMARLSRSKEAGNNTAI